MYKTEETMSTPAPATPILHKIANRFGEQLALMEKTVCGLHNKVDKIVKCHEKTKEADPTANESPATDFNTAMIALLSRFEDTNEKLVDILNHLEDVV